MQSLERAITGPNPHTPFSRLYALLYMYAIAVEVRDSPQGRERDCRQTERLATKHFFLPVCTLGG